MLKIDVSPPMVYVLLRSEYLHFGLHVPHPPPRRILRTLCVNSGSNMLSPPASASASASDSTSTSPSASLLSPDPSSILRVQDPGSVSSMALYTRRFTNSGNPVIGNSDRTSEIETAEIWSSLRWCPANQYDLTLEPQGGKIRAGACPGQSLRNVLP
jgi:hypothetical protein